MLATACDRYQAHHVAGNDVDVLHCILKGDATVGGGIVIRVADIHEAELVLPPVEEAQDGLVSQTYLP